MKVHLYLAVIALAVLFLTGCDKILHGESTTYSSNFSGRRFDKIVPGMSVADVTTLLGNPLGQSTQEWSEVWSYFPPGPQQSAAAGGMMTFDLFGPVTNLRFSKAGSVSATSGDYLAGDFVGLTKSQVREKTGEPNKLELREHEIIFHYTEASKRGSGTYKMRTVHFDESGKVRKTLKETHYD